MPWINNIPLIAILRGITPQQAPAHVEVLLKEGFNAIEIPLNSPSWQESVTACVKRFGTQGLIGGGTVLTESDVETLYVAGARLIVTPNINPTVIAHALGHGMVLACGCLTPTEIFKAIELGVKTIKIFPAAAMGSSYIKAIKAVLPQDISLMAVGGITPENLQEYMQAGCIGAGLGGDLYRAGQSVEVTAERARAFLAAYHHAHHGG
ncbi:2-dehydro-3-deoxy-6-phosphogalactonate aldolase [Entomobacter blattae]|uniref:2-dehydro-3-deoxy-6-phosphogalactonate aldolase n=1 Tax=Entomobacter blattae TaxID=2762277 RepID=A0A7H1NRA2_9PROT|nr:2-dehydro-3-deoxy-6-phosphogalactonate aldolase [Entomobacter blattae]QNT78312.1 2-dehydro-3-deoxy-6-phosphogalactonate aldolase [Entomobacter blattae]